MVGIPTNNNDVFAIVPISGRNQDANESVVKDLFHVVIRVFKCSGNVAEGDSCITFKQFGNARTVIDLHTVSSVVYCLV